MKYLILLTTLLISSSSSAVECINYGWYSDASEIHYYRKFSYATVENCSNNESGNILLTIDEYDGLLYGDGYQQITQAEYDEYLVLKEAQTPYDQIINTLVELFEFSNEDFAQITAMFLVAFITGHALGRVARLLGKT